MWVRYTTKGFKEMIKFIMRFVLFCIVVEHWDRIDFVLKVLYSHSFESSRLIT